MGLHGMRRHILVIEDDRETADLIEEDLAERGFHVTVAHSGELGLASVLRAPPDLILSDISMPGLSGLEVLGRLLESGQRFAEIPFVFLTALADRDSELRGRRMGADDYITKPVDFEMLATIITARLARGGRHFAASKHYDLNNREAEVLTWAARGKTSAEIARIVDLTKRTVDFHIDNARGKLNAATRMHAAVIAASVGLIEL